MKEMVNENKEMRREIERMKKKIGGKVKSFEEQINEDKKRVDEMIAEMKKEQLEAKKQNVEIGNGKVTPRIQIGRRQTQRMNQNGNEFEKMKKSVDSLNDSVGLLNDSMKKQEGMNEEFLGMIDGMTMKNEEIVKEMNERYEKMKEYVDERMDINEDIRMKVEGTIEE